MCQLEQVSIVVSATLESYRDDFHALIESYAESSLKNGEKSCDFFVDIASMMNGTWHISAEIEFDHIAEFKQFDWNEVLKIDVENLTEDEMMALLDEAYKVGYIWLEQQLIIAKTKIKNIEIKLFHNGSLDYQPL